MNFKEEIEKILSSLKKRGIDRRSIEKDMDYREGYIDQLLSKGGNNKFLKRLEKYNIAKSKKDVSHETITLHDGETFNRLLKVLEQHAETIGSQQRTINILVEREQPPDIRKEA